MLAHLRNLVGHSEWANAVFCHTWGKSPAREHEELRQRFRHILGVQSGFLCVFRGEAATIPKDEAPPSYDDLKARAIASHASLREFVAALPPDGLARSVQIPWIPDPDFNLTVGEALVQV